MTPETHINTPRLVGDFLRAAYANGFEAVTIQGQAAFHLQRQARESGTRLEYDPDLAICLTPSAAREFGSGPHLPCQAVAQDDLGNWSVVTVSGYTVQFLADEVEDPDEVVTVVLNQSQVENLEYCLPVGHFGLKILETRVKGTRAQLRDAIEMLDLDTIIEMREQRRDTDLSFAQEDHNRRMITRGYRNLVNKLRKAVK